MQVLIGSADAAICELVVAVVLDLGCSWLGGEDYAQVCQHVTGNSPDVVLVDTNLPYFNGEHFIQTVRQAHSKKWLPIILLADTTHTAATAELLANGADFFFVKPLNTDLLAGKLQALQRLIDDHKRLRTIIDHSLDGVIIYDAQGNIQQLNREAEKTFGYRDYEILDKPITTLVDTNHIQELRQELKTRDLNAIWHPREAVGHHKKGHLFPIELRLEIMHSRGAELTALMVRDISARKQQEEKIRTLALHDTLTGLPNRALLTEYLAKTIQTCEQDGRLSAVLFIDLDRFKIINDTYGHPTGDAVLQTIAQRLSQAVRPNDAVARLGGDEFVVLLRGLRSSQYAALIAERIRIECETPVPVGDKKFTLSSSIGIALYPKDGQDPATLVRNADTAMYFAKQNGKNAHAFYNEELNEKNRELLAIEQDLHQALKKKEFILYYQPQLSIHSGRISGVEALIRWQKPNAGLIPPNKFIPVAESTGLILPLGEWVLYEACRQNRIWQEMGLPRIKVGVNISPRQFNDTLPDKVERVLQETGLAAHLLDLEITESLLMHNVDHAIAIMRDLTSMGVHLSIDDFGTGYSSLSYLKRFPIETLKVDRSFVKDILEDEDDLAIASAIVALGKRLGMTTLAEGVEKPQQVEALRKIGCEYYQGYLFSPPVPPEKIIPFLQPGVKSGN